MPVSPTPCCDRSGILILLVLQGMAGCVHRAMKKTKKNVGEQEGEENAAGEVWSGHCTHRTSLPTLKSGVKDVSVVLFRIERGTGTAPPPPPPR